MSKKSNKIYTINDALQIVNQLVDVNYHNRKSGFTNRNIAVEFVGEKGIGKSEAVRDYAISKGYAFVKRELAQVSDETSLYGYPRKTFRVQKIEESPYLDNGVQKTKRKIFNRKVEVNELQRYLDDGYIQQSKDSELSYSTPEWVNELAKTEKSILFIDELKRAMPHIAQATMNLIQNGQYGDWSLPIGCTIVLANNPVDGEYNVSGFDDAGNDRMFTYFLKGDIESWMEWASSHFIPEACINFLYKTEEARDGKDTPSYRMWSNFFMSISNLNLRSSGDLKTIYRLGSGSVGENMTLLFQTFIENNLDIIPSLKWIFDPKTTDSDVIKALNKCVVTVDGNGNNIIRNDIKGLLGLRLKTYFRQSNITVQEIERFGRICDSEVILKDSLMYILTDISKSDHPNNKLIGTLVRNNTVSSILLNSKEIV